MSEGRREVVGWLVGTQARDCREWGEIVRPGNQVVLPRHVIMGNSPVFFCLMGAGGQQDTCHAAKTKGCVDLPMSCDYYHKAGEMRRGHRTLSAFLRSLGKARCSSQGLFGLQQWSPASASNQSSPAALSTHKSSKGRRLKAEWCFGLSSSFPPGIPGESQGSSGQFWEPGELRVPPGW